MSRAKRDAALALGVFAGGFALGVATMVWLAPALTDDQWLTVTRLCLFWLAGVAASALVWSKADEY